MITSDLFGEESYFADPDLFWERQNRAIAEVVTELEEDGWEDIVLLDVGANWCRWEHSKVSQENGGKVYIQPRSNGEVTVHNGLLPEKQAKRLARTQAGDEAISDIAKPELTMTSPKLLVHPQS